MVVTGLVAIATDKARNNNSNSLVLTYLFTHIVTGGIPVLTNRLQERYRAAPERGARSVEPVRVRVEH